MSKLLIIFSLLIVSIVGYDYYRFRGTSLVITNYILKVQGDISNSNNYVRYQQFLEECKEVETPEYGPAGGYGLCQIDPCNEICFKIEISK